MCRSLLPIMGVAFRASRLEMQISQEPFPRFIFSQWKQDEWPSKESAVFRRVREDATTARHVLAAWSPARRPATVRAAYPALPPGAGLN